jgi:SAM-dependent methyltransferase
MGKMSALGRFSAFVPRYLKSPVRRMLRFAPTAFKYQSELSYWRRQWSLMQFENEYYRGTMLDMAGQSDDEFLRDKIVADFGCGPQGSLLWAASAKVRIGIDVLADAYGEFNIRSHNMVYVTSTENMIPLPSNYVDVMFTLNAVDHVSYFRQMCSELVRVLAPGGLFIGVFNLGEPPTFSEPQTLSEALIDRALLSRLDVQHRRVAGIGPDGDTYRPLFDHSPPPSGGISRLLVRATKLPA